MAKNIEYQIIVSFIYIYDSYFVSFGITRYFSISMMTEASIHLRRYHVLINALIIALIVSSIVLFYTSCLLLSLYSSDTINDL